MKCEVVQEQLSNYIDGDIAGELRNEITAHLRVCDRCNVLHDSLRKLLLIVADDRILEPPVGYAERLHNFVNRHL